MTADMNTDLGKLKSIIAKAQHSATPEGEKEVCWRTIGRLVCKHGMAIFAGTAPVAPTAPRNGYSSAPLHPRSEAYVHAMQRMADELLRSARGTPYQRVRPQATPPTDITRITIDGETVTLNPVYFFKRHNKAWGLQVWLFPEAAPEAVWIPFSEISVSQRRLLKEKTFGSIAIPLWIAKQKGLVSA